MAGVPPVGPMPPNPALPHAQVLPVPAQAGGLAQAGVNGVLLRAPPAPPLPVAPGAVANPQALAAAAALGRAVLAGPNNGVVPLPGLGGRGVLTAQQAQAQTVWAQQVLAQALGRLAAGQMGAGAAALALAQGQLALREGRRCCHRLWLRGHGAAGCVGRFAI